MTVQTQQSTSWFDRIKQSLGGVLVGLALMLAMTVLLFSNEGRAVTTSRALAEGAGSVVSQDAGKVDPALEGQLVHLIGKATSETDLQDPVLGIQVPALVLERHVQMYQWHERSEQQREVALGGSETVRTTHRYALDWSSSAIDSSRFVQPQGHDNPPMIIGQARIAQQEVQLGARQLGSEILAQLSTEAPMPVPPHSLPAVEQALGQPGRVHLLEDGGLHVGQDPLSPQPGDYRIHLRVLPLQAVSVVGRQQGSRVVPYVAGNGERVLIARTGEHAAAALFDGAQQANQTWTWIMRALGTAGMVVAVGMLLRPLPVLASVLPLAGRLVSVGTGVMGAVLGAGLSLLVVSVAWLFHRPLLSLGLLVLVAGLIVAAVVLVRRQSLPAAEDALSKRA